MNLKFKPYKNKDFFINLPLGWRALSKKMVYSFYNKDGSGALQISTYTQTKGKIDLTEKLVRFMNEKSINDIIKKSKGEYDYVEKSFVKNKFFTYVRILSAGSYFALITYNCHFDNIDKSELIIAKKIFDSFKFNIKGN